MHNMSTASEKHQSSGNSALQTKRIENPVFPLAGQQEEPEIQTPDAQSKQRVWDKYKSMMAATPRKSIKQTSVEVDEVEKPVKPEKPSVAPQEEEQETGLSGLLKRYQSKKSERADMKSLKVE